MKFYSTYFLVPEKSGGDWLAYEAIEMTMVEDQFRMVTLAAIVPSLERGMWFMVLDMQDACFHMDVYPTQFPEIHGWPSSLPIQDSTV